MGRWLRLAAAGGAAGTAVAVMLELLDGRRPFLSELAVSLAIALTIALMSGAVVPPIARRLPWRRPVLAWAALTAVFLGVAAAGCVLASGFLVAVGLVPASHGRALLAVALRISAVVSLGVGLGCVVFESMRAQRDAALAELSAREAERARAGELAAEARLASLEARLHPHFLFNTLNAISALIPEDPARAEALVEQLAALLRFSLDAGRRHTVALAAELEIVRAYLGIEGARLGDRLRWRIDVPDAVADRSVPALALHTLVQNSVKHVAAARAEPTEVRITGEAADDGVRLTVWDTGPKFSLDAAPAGHGLEMLRGRLELLYGTAARLEIDGVDGGKAVCLTLPERAWARPT